MLQGSYRGLTNFVTEIRDCKTYDLEKERVTKELEKVQSILSEPKSKPYDRIKSTLKLLYIQTLGYDISSFENHCLSMAKSPNYLEKRAGYLTFPTFLGTETATQDRIMRILQADLVASDANVKLLALSTLSSLSPSETNSKAIIDNVVPLLMQKCSRDLYQRAISCLSLLCSTETGWKFLTSQDAAHMLQKCLTEKDPGLLTSTVSFLYKLIFVAKEVGQQNIFSFLLPGLFQVLNIWLLDSSFDSSSYSYYEIPCPFLLSNVWKLIGLFPASTIMEFNRQSKSLISNLFLKCLSYIRNGDHSNRRNASFSISFEALKVVSKLPFSRDLFIHSLTLIMSLISEDVRPTTRYFVLRALTELSFLPETWTNIQRNFSILLPFSQSQGVDKEREEPLWFHLSVELLSSVCNANNVEQVLDYILRICSMFSLSDLQQRLVMDKCLSLTKRFLQNEEKLFTVVVVLLSVCDEAKTGEITNLFLTQLHGSKSLQSESMKQFSQLLYSGSLLEPGLLRLIFLVFPMHSYLLISSGACNAVDVITLLYRQMCYHKKLYSLQSSFLNFLMKWIECHPEAVATAVDILKKYTTSQDLEVQIRACEYLKFIS
ncbi:AP-2 complex subunit alpha isoform 2 [Galdieria sulphuraria]|nr:AP-2 complex subunit alpha isoform 2 [Galdieria sulphuraria]EME31824.1 AP-2 complex subunit alpha isoform 2 [Galdieria sulphuraria]|eukprot:XP_005708344.1 AP-2 complex subunit alpha isoform 2 [Galdieria sulphuraria]